jgi:hypothetical protein
MSQHIYIANHNQQDAYVVAGKSELWHIGDFLTDIAFFAVGIGEIKAALSVANLPGTINTVRDLFQVMKVTAGLLSGTIATGSRSAEAAKEVVDAFKKNSQKISSGDHKDVLNTGFLDYLSPSGIAGVLNTDTITLVIMTDEGKKVTEFSTNIDHSWIVTPSRVVRSKYGTLNVEDPGAGQYAWSK